MAALLIIFGEGLWYVLAAFRARSMPAPCCAGGAAAAVGILLVIGLLLQAPSLILDDFPHKRR